MKIMIRPKRKERISERKHPGDPEPEWCSPGSIEQELDMCETGSLRGDDILYRHGVEPLQYTGDPQELDLIIGQGEDANWEVDLSEEDREGDEMSGDEHSSGLEGGEPELESQPNIASGLPGDRTRRVDQEWRSEGVFYPEEVEILKVPKLSKSAKVPRVSTSRTRKTSKTLRSRKAPKTLTVHGKPKAHSTRKTHKSARVRKGSKSSRPSGRSLGRSSGKSFGR